MSDQLAPVKMEESIVQPTAAVVDDWQNDCHQLSERIVHLQKNDLWSDCEFVVGNDGAAAPITAHKIILASASTVFAAMFYGAVAETTTNAETGRTRVRVPNVEPHIFRMLLAYMYEDIMDVTAMEPAMGLFAAAHQYMLGDVENHCYAFMQNNLNSSNVCSVYEFAILFDKKMLKAQCLNYICTNTLAVLASPSIARIQLSMLNTILDMDHLQAGSELPLFTVVNQLSENVAKSK